MKYLATLTLAALLSFSGAANANVATPMCTRIQDSGTFTSEGFDTWRFMGPICLMTDNSIQFLAWYVSGPKAGTGEWLPAGPIMPAYDRDACNWATPTWTGLAPYMDPGPAHLCGNSTCVNWDGTYRVIGDGDPNATGASARAGVVLTTVVGTQHHTYILAIKTASDRAGAGACGVFGGPGNVGQFILLDQHGHFLN